MKQLIGNTDIVVLYPKKKSKEAIVVNHSLNYYSHIVGLTVISYRRRVKASSVITR